MLMLHTGFSPKKSVNYKDDHIWYHLAECRQNTARTRGATYTINIQHEQTEKTNSKNRSITSVPTDNINVNSTVFELSAYQIRKKNRVKYLDVERNNLQVLENNMNHFPSPSSYITDRFTNCLSKGIKKKTQRRHYFKTQLGSQQHIWSLIWKEQNERRCIQNSWQSISDTTDSISWTCNLHTQNGCVSTATKIRRYFES